ncbi:MAG: hypothetical protein KDC70_16560, partial [Saprospiraceae bacterium]|nr:hypothetical protein [Saprospiraceae bacterium]
MDRPAGFWRRYAAYSLDLLVPLALSVPLLWRSGERVLAQTAQGIAQCQSRLFELADATPDLAQAPQAALLA